jgi:hypothetical protein
MQSKLQWLTVNTWRPRHRHNFTASHTFSQLFKVYPIKFNASPVAVNPLPKSIGTPRATSRIRLGYNTGCAILTDYIQNGWFTYRDVFNILGRKHIYFLMKFWQGSFQSISRGFNWFAASIGISWILFTTLKGIISGGYICPNVLTLISEAWQGWY